MSVPIPGTAASYVFSCAVAYVVSLMTSTAGVSGAFLLLPFQVSVLGFATPAVTPTNHLFNVVAIPSGIYRYVRERRMVWPLAAVIAIGTMPGVVAGSLVRIHVLPDARRFKVFVGTVLLLLGMHLAITVWRRVHEKTAAKSGAFLVRAVRLGWRRLEYEFQGSEYGIPTVKLACIAAVIGMIGGTYGVGGGAMMAPILVSVARLPVHTTAGATLMATFLTSLVGVAFFATAGRLLGQPQLVPDWLLGASLGLGGLLGMYSGARLQRYLPARAIEAVLAVATTGLGLSYVIQYFQR